MNIALTITLFVCFLTYVTQSADWEHLATGPWAAREGLMGVVFNGYIYMSGGRQDTSFFNDVYRLNGTCNINSCEWELITNNAEWRARGYHIMIEHLDYMYIIGGQNYTNFYNDIWRSQDGETWEQIIGNNFINSSDRTNSKQFEQRAGLAAISYQNKTLYVMGGCLNNPPDRILYNDVWISTDDGKTWELLIGESGWRPRSGARIQILDNTMYLAAGEFGFSSPTQYDDVWKLNLDSSNGNDGWNLVTKEPGWDKRSGHGFIIDRKGIFWIIAGYFDKHDLWRSDDNGQTWNMTRNDDFNCNSQSCGRYDFWSLIFQDNLIIFGGDGDYSTFGGEYNETWRLYLGEQ